MFPFGRKIRFICPGCALVSQLDRRYVRDHEDELSRDPGGPPEIECHWCHQGLMIPIHYRFRNGRTFQIPKDRLRQLRQRQQKAYF